eukprot:268008-Prymnesium_polylepis.1
MATGALRTADSAKRWEGGAGALSAPTVRCCGADAPPRASRARFRARGAGSRAWPTHVAPLRAAFARAELAARPVPAERRGLRLLLRRRATTRAFLGIGLHRLAMRRRARLALARAGVSPVAVARARVVGGVRARTARAA